MSAEPYCCGLRVVQLQLFLLFLVWICYFNHKYIRKQFKLFQNCSSLKISFCISVLKLYFQNFVLSKSSRKCQGDKM